MEVSLPDKNDRLFQPEENFFKGAWISNPHDKFVMYSEGYKKAAEVLYSFCKGNSFFNNTVVYPIVFLYRHFLELRLKELIVMGYSYLDMVKDFPNNHNLLNLWNLYRNEILVNVEDFDKDALNNVERLIKEFNQIDGNSFSFRYPVDTSKERKPSLSIDTIDLENFSKVMEKLIYFFDWQKDIFYHYIDLKNEMMADLYRDYYH